MQALVTIYPHCTHLRRHLSSRKRTRASCICLVAGCYTMIRNKWRTEVAKRTSYILFRCMFQGKNTRNTKFPFNKQTKKRSREKKNVFTNKKDPTHIFPCKDRYTHEVNTFSYELCSKWFGVETVQVFERQTTVKLIFSLNLVGTACVSKSLAWKLLIFSTSEFLMPLKFRTLHAVSALYSWLHLMVFKSRWND